MATFNEMLQARFDQGKFLCVGLDTDLNKIPDCIRSCSPTRRLTILNFNTAIIGATCRFVSSYKPNLAFYLANGSAGYEALIDTCEYIRTFFPEIPIILDAKDMDIGNTNLGYVQMAFERCGAHAITVNPYLGKDAAQPFLDMKDKGIIVLCRTSNVGSGEFQDRFVQLDIKEYDAFIQRLSLDPTRGVPMYQYVAFRISEYWNENNNCAVVVGATYPDELWVVRKIIGDMPILIPGIGAQGGDLESTIRAGKNSTGQGMIINSSRDIIYASKSDDFEEAAFKKAKALNDSIISFLNM